MDDQAPSGVTAPWLLALAWPAGTVFLCCLSQADTYTGLLEKPAPPTAVTWVLLTLFLAWTLLVPAVGLAISLRRRQVAPALTHIATLVLAVGVSVAAVYALDL
jgi:hypothetical protein